MKFSSVINLFLAQCWSVHALDQNIPLNNEYHRELVSEIPVDRPVSYECEFINRWTSFRHPNRFPEPPAFWSRPLMVSHNNEYTMWSVDQVTSTGVQGVAETGSLRVLEQEIFAAGSSIKNYVLSDAFRPIGDRHSASMRGVLEMDSEHRLISTITKISPSPDWFSGLNSYSPVMNGMWLESFTVDSYPWDAGSEDGTDYIMRNDPTDPKVSPSRFTAYTVPKSGVFLNTDGDNVLPVGQWSCGTVVSGGPTPTPTPTPVKTCDEDGTKKFFRFNNQGLAPPDRPQDCMWLAQQKSVVQDRHCRRTRNSGIQPEDDTPLAREACPETCETCPNEMADEL